MSTLIVVSGPAEGDHYALEKATTVIGRDAKCPIQIVDEKISRVHLQVRYAKDDDSYHAEDLKSANGVTLNGLPMRDETRLNNGDLLELGASKIMYFTRDFPDRKSAMDFYKLSGERTKGTIIQ
jgi:S-DNA-T family DNA segregation ATPase FtsK/SpoIIIE